MDAVFLPNVFVTRGEVAEFALIDAFQKKTTALADSDLRYVKLQKGEKKFCAFVVFRSPAMAKVGLQVATNLWQTKGSPIRAKPQLESSTEPSNSLSVYVDETSKNLSLARELNTLKLDAGGEREARVLYFHQCSPCLSKQSVKSALESAVVPSDSVEIRIGSRPNPKASGSVVTLSLEFPNEKECLEAAATIDKWRRRNNTVFFRRPSLKALQPTTSAPGETLLVDAELRLEREREALHAKQLEANLIFIPHVDESVAEWEVSAFLSANGIQDVKKLTCRPPAGYATKAMMWIEFTNEDSCLAAARAILLLVVRGHRIFKLAPRLNNQSRTMKKPKKTHENNSQPSSVERLTTYQAKVKLQGGSADTLVLEKIPQDCDLEYLEDALRELCPDHILEITGGAIRPPTSQPDTDHRMEDGRSSEDEKVPTRRVFVLCSGSEECALVYSALVGQQVELISGQSISLSHISLARNQTRRSQRPHPSTVQ